MSVSVSSGYVGLRFARTCCHGIAGSLALLSAWPQDRRAVDGSAFSVSRGGNNTIARCSQLASDLLSPLDNWSFAPRGVSGHQSANVRTWGRLP